VHAKHTLPDLGYDFNALEPYVSADIMKLHYEKHHATYVNNLNVASEKLAEANAKGDVAAAIALGPAIRFNGGGHINHSIFWKNLTSHAKSGEASGALKSAIERDFGSLEQLQTRMSAQSVAVQGSGWGWLGFNKQSKKLEIATCPNQDPLEATTGLVPLFGIDVWEHAYYLQYKNVRPDYVKAIWNIANWHDISERFAAANKA
jgi:Fe-Mn family superoxide dismutase